MRKGYFFILLLVQLCTSPSFAQWTCKTIDPEFDDAVKIAYTKPHHGASLVLGEFTKNYYSNWISKQSFSRIEEQCIKLSLGSFFKVFDRGNIPLILTTNNTYWCFNIEDRCSVYSFELSYSIGDKYKRYRNTDPESYYLVEGYEHCFIITYEKGIYFIELPSKEFWQDFKSASSVKIRIKHNENSDYQYYEFDMSGSSKAFNYVTAKEPTPIKWLEDDIHNAIKQPKDEAQKSQEQKVSNNKVAPATIIRPDEMEAATFNSPVLNSFYEYLTYRNSFSQSNDYYWNNFALCDITGDGIPELWIETGTCEADHILLGYRYINNSVKKFYEGTAFHSGFAYGKGYFIRYTSWMGYEETYKMAFNPTTNSIIETLIYAAEIDLDENETVKTNKINENQPTDTYGFIEFSPFTDAKKYFTDLDKKGLYR